MKRRLYVVVRGDLPPGLRMAQACHAVREFSYKYPELDVGENLIVLEVRNEAELLRIHLDVNWTCVDAEVVLFREPDLKNEFTAFAADGRARPALSCLPLAGRPRERCGPVIWPPSHVPPTSNLT